mmetsp:Transcript_2899/g.1964  ORF Transcript_2899/g.1964 Transcript_2899/m.1964 type:complete len:128 (+) Transcript_2899:402-785(+)
MGFEGVFVSTLYPSFVSIMSNWFSKKNRGFIVGVWSTCQNVGNIIGIQLAAALISVFNDQWYWLLISIGCFFYMYAPVLFFFLVPEPQKVGVYIDELQGAVLTEQEQQRIVELAMNQAHSHEASNEA